MRRWLRLAVSAACALAGLVMLTALIPIVVASDMTAVQFDLVLETYREQMAMIKWAIGGASVAIAAAMAYLVRELVASKGRTIDEIKAATALTDDEKELRIAEHQKTRDMIREHADKVNERMQRLEDEIHERHEPERRPRRSTASGDRGD